MKRSEMVEKMVGKSMSQHAIWQAYTNIDSFQEIRKQR